MRAGERERDLGRGNRYKLIQSLSDKSLCQECCIRELAEAARGHRALRKRRENIQD